MRDHRRGRHWARRVVPVLLALGLVAAACGGDDDDAAPPTTAGGEETTVTELEPRQGGSIVVGIEADTATPWTPAESTCAVSCTVVMRAVYDPLLALGEDGKMHPMLAESATPNDDFTVWTITVREGVQFHDGTPLDGAAVVENLQRYRNSFLTGKGLLDVQDVAVSSDDPMTVVVTLKRPWVTFDYYLGGYVASPTWLAATDADPTLETKPVGTGPFVYEDYRVGQYFRATRNPGYWREGLPYLDAIEYRIIPDALTRARALAGGDIDMFHTTNGETIADLRESGDTPFVEQTRYAETSYLLLNVTQPPLDDASVRCALGAAIDNASIRESIGAGVGELANGPFSPDQLGYLEDSGYPAFDPEAARAAIEAYEAANGPVVVDYTTTNDATNLLIAQAVQQMWADIGVDTTIAQLEQGQFIVAALNGNFQVFSWRSHGGPDPDQQRVWWNSETALPVGQLALNFGRITDPVIDENLDILREDPDPEARQAAAEAVNRQFGEQCYDLWGSWTVWAIPHGEQVQGIETYELPDGSLAQPGSGSFWPAGIWLSS
ncbi:MAG: ABC transporter substrate-binding protein [Acidimicrobiales bacterium]|nr:ABC transporter substrate-binding protein [Acidimicrobiales bacterium]